MFWDKKGNQREKTSSEVKRNVPNKMSERGEVGKCQMAEKHTKGFWRGVSAWKKER